MKKHRIALQDAIHLGRRVLICPSVKAEESEDREIRPNELRNKMARKTFPVIALPKLRQVIIDQGALIVHPRDRLRQTTPLK
jgi:hypothetical protein